MKLPKQNNEAKEFKKIMFLYDSALKEVNTKIEILNNEFKMAHQYNPIEHITSRIKSPQSIAKKLHHNGKEMTLENIVKFINDVAGIRIICSFTSDIFRIADLISKQSDVKVLKVKDYITNPKENGYSSYHMIVAVPIYLTNAVVDTKVEIQIRTIAMDFWASLEHKIYYKFEGNAPTRIRNELKECAEIVAFLDQKMLSINEEIKYYSNTIDEQDKELEIEMKESFGNVFEEELNIKKEMNYKKEQFLLEDNMLREIEKEDDFIIIDHNKECNKDKSKKATKKENKTKKIKEEKIEGKILNFFKLNTN